MPSHPEKKRASLPSSEADFSEEEVEKLRWSVIESFFAGHDIMDLQKESYDNFVAKLVPDIIRDIGTVKVEKDGKVAKVVMQNPVFLPPKGLSGQAMWPTECLQSNVNYAASLVVDVLYYPPGEDRPTEYKERCLGNVPVMVGSKLCTTFGASDEELMRHGEDLKDTGGYFIVRPKAEDGICQKKIVTIHERAKHNYPTILIPKKSKARMCIYAEIKSHGKIYRQTSTSIGFDSRDKNVMWAVLPWNDGKLIPLGILFKAFGVEDVDIIFRLVFGNNYKKDPDYNFLMKTLEYSFECDTQEKALNYIGAKCKSQTAEADAADAEAADAEMAADEDDGWDQDEVEESELEDLLKDSPEHIYATKLLANDVFPHIGEGEEFFWKKAQYLGYVVLKLIRTYTSRYSMELRDHYSNKRTISTGARLGHQLMQSLRKFNSDLVTNIFSCMDQKKNPKILQILNKSNIITSNMISAISSNNWLFKVTGSKGPKGLSQLYDNFSHLGALANPRRLVVPINDAGKMTLPRQVGGEQPFLIDPADTPEGKRSGLVKPTSVIGNITLGTDPSPIKKILVKKLEGMHEGYPTPMTPDDTTSEIYSYKKVFVEGDIVGYVKDPMEIVSYIRELRLKGKIDRQISVSCFFEIGGDVMIHTDAGRLYAPLLRVEDGRLVLLKYHKTLKERSMDWDEIMEKGIAEYSDSSERDTLLIAITYEDLVKGSGSPYEYTHCEMDPSLMYSTSVSNVPFPGHNQSTRLTYQAGMGKQACTVPFTNFRDVFHGSFHVLHNPQRPLASSRVAEQFGASELPSGANCYTLVACADYTEEDAVVINKMSIDRGLFVSSAVLNYSCTERKDRLETFGRPKNAPDLNITHLQPNGIAAIGSLVVNGDVLVCKLVTNNGVETIEDKILYKETLPGIVDSYQMVQSEGYRCVKIKVIQLRTPVVGDKFAARHGQKGVCGYIREQADMPFSEDGITPDIIINALAFPSRMTIAMILEMAYGIAYMETGILGKYTIKEVYDEMFGEKDLKGKTTKKHTPIKSKEFMERSILPPATINGATIVGGIDATAFKKIDFPALFAELKKLGITLGDRPFYDGITGKELKTLCFCGPVFYQRLKHQVEDKYHARATGPHASLTRQPPDGRAANGGHRTGSMESDCMIGSGSSYVVQDRLCISSDYFKTHACGVCGSPAYVDARERVTPCRLCGSTDIREMHMPYGAKLMLQELEAIGISTRTFVFPPLATLETKKRPVPPTIRNHRK
jgi:DNA-directed RNA polymerase beta subunit